MRLREITASNEVILKLHGISTNFNKQKSAIDVIDYLTKTSPNNSGYKPLLVNIIKGFDEFLTMDTLDWSDSDLINIRTTVETLRNKSQSILDRI